MSDNQSLEDLYNRPYADSPIPQIFKHRPGYKPSIIRITPEEALKYIPVLEDQYGGEARFFTMEPDPKDSEWSNVVYYTNRSNRPLDISPDFSLDDATWIYVLSNPSIPGQVKIGMTDRTVDERKKELDKGSGVPTPFVIEYQFPCINAGRLEKEIHMYLEMEGLRVNNGREFFYLHPETAISIISKLGKPYKINQKSED